MSNNTATPTTAKKLKPSKIVNTLIEALMVKTGVKAGPEVTCCR
jgi:hypothetical protein